MFKKAFIQKQNKLKIEEELLCSYLERKSIPVEFITQKQIDRRRLLIERDTLVVGDISCVSGALKQLKIDVPEPNSYPDSLKVFLYRKVWDSTLSKLMFKIDHGGSDPVFAKPADSLKRFTGQVFRNSNDFYFLHSVSKKTKIHCSEVVNWVSEYRVYVVNSEIREVSYYDGDESIKIDNEIVEKSISALDKVNESYAGYGIDFGVLDTGETALIEMNDGYGLGAYNIGSKDYSELIIARWFELMESKKE
ncbi:MAG: ATP-grasp domain-containing protein [Desulfobacterales bacterium]|nr:ATP-grasp domain-containing protein [Desulfobacterales bacterium]